MHKQRGEASRHDRPGPDADHARKFLTAVNLGAKEIRGLFVTYLLFCLYLALSAGGTTHEQLLRGSTIKLPLIDSSISIVGFYFIAPLLLIILHLWLWTHLALIAENLHAFKEELRRLIATRHADEADILRQSLENFGLLHSVTLDLTPRARSWYGFFFSAIDVIALALVPWAVLLLVQVQFLPYHSSAITWWHRALLISDMVAVGLFWPLVMSGKFSGFAERWKPFQPIVLRASPAVMGWGIGLICAIVERGHRPVQWLGGMLLLAATLYLLAPLRQRSAVVLTSIAITFAFISVMLFTFAGENQSRFVIGPAARAADFLTTKLSRDQRWSPASDDTRYVFRRQELVSRAIYLPGAALVNGTLSEDTKAKLRARDDSALLFVTGLDLSGRDLRHAYLRQASLPNADLTHADMRAATISDAYMPGAVLFHIKATGSSANGVDLRYADLRGAHFSDASLNKARLSCARLDGIELDTNDLRDIEIAFVDFSNVDGRWGSILERYTRRPSSAQQQRELLELGHALGFGRTCSAEKELRATH